MKITDLNGYPIEVTNLNEAIRQTKQYKQYCHEDNSYLEFDKRQRAYWTDLYEKLNTIKKTIKRNFKILEQ